MFLPTCSDTDRPWLKGAIHATTAALYVLMLAYHVSAAVLHWQGTHEGQDRD